MKVIILILASTYILSQTISDFKDPNENRVFRDKNISAVGQRFAFNSSGLIKSIRIKLNGGKGKGELHLYSNEAGRPIPFMEEVILKVPFEKEFEQSGWVELETSIKIDYHQIFVVVNCYDDFDVVTSKTENTDICKSKYGDFYSQLLKVEDKWVTAKYGFLIELDFEQTEDKDDNIFEKVDLDFGNTSNIIVYDINSDSKQDIITGNQILLNKGNFEFESYIVGNDSSYIYSLATNLDKDEYLDFVFFTSDSLAKTIIIEPDEEGLMTKIDMDRYLPSSPIQTRKVQLNQTTNYIMAFENIHDFSLVLFDDKLAVIDSISIDDFISFYSENDSLFISTQDGGIYYLEINNTINLYKKDTELNYIIGKTSTLDFNATNELTNIQNIISISVKDHKNYFSAAERISTLRSIDYYDRDIGSIFLDYDNDGDYDIITASMCSCRKSRLFENMNGKYEDITKKSGFNNESFYYDGISADLNNNGKLDLIMRKENGLVIYKNKSKNSNNYIKIENSGYENLTISNGLTQKYKVNMLNNGFLVQGPNVYHIGLGEESADSMIVNKGNKVYLIENPLTNQTLRLDLKDATPINKNLDVTAFPSPFYDEITFELSSKEIGEAIISIHDLQGKQIYEISRILKKGTTKVAIRDGKLLSDLPSGAYIYTVTFNNRKYQEKLIKI